MVETDFIKNIDPEEGPANLELHFINGVNVTIDFSHQTWEYDEDNDEDSYLSGIYVLDDDTVIDYDGCYELPKEVMFVLGKFYKLDL